MSGSGRQRVASNDLVVEGTAGVSRTFSACLGVSAHWLLSSASERSKQVEFLV